MHTLLKTCLFILVAAFFVPGCASNQPANEKEGVLTEHNLPEDFLDEEHYFTARAEVNSSREQIAVRRAEAEAIHSVGEQMNHFVNEILRFEEQRDPTDPVQLPRFIVLENMESYKEYLEFSEPSINIQPDSSYKVVLFARFPKNKLPEFITEENFEQGEFLERFQEKNGVEWLRERVAEELKIQ